MSTLDKLITTALEQLDGTTDPDGRTAILRNLAARAATLQQVVDTNKLYAEADQFERSVPPVSDMANVYGVAVASIIRRCADIVGRNL